MYVNRTHNRIKYTHIYLASEVCFACGILFMMLCAITKMFKPQMENNITAFDAIIVLGSIILGIVLRLVIKFHVFIDVEGIHIVLRQSKKVLTLPREVFQSSDVIISPRGSSFIILTRNNSLPPELRYAIASNSLPSDEVVREFGLEYNIAKYMRGKISEEEFFSQNVYILQFNYARSNMEKFYRHFCEVWNWENTGDGFHAPN